MKVHCERCGDAIAAEDGAVFLSEAGHGYPNVRAPDNTACFIAHYRCAPDAYTIGFDRVVEPMGGPESDSVEGWVAHVGAKVWATPVVLAALAGRLAMVLVARDRG